MAPMIKNGSSPLTTASGKWCRRWFQRQIFFAREEADEWAAFQRPVIAHGAAEHGILRFERVQHGGNGDRRRDIEVHSVAFDLGELP